MIPTLFFVASLIGALATTVTLFRARRPAVLSFMIMFAGWLTGEAVWLAVPGRAESFELPLAAPLADLLAGVLASGRVTAWSRTAPTTSAPWATRGRRRWRRTR
mgnify:CR=1 FL=1